MDNIDGLPLRTTDLVINEISIKLKLLDNSQGILEENLNDYFTNEKSIPYYADLWPTGFGLALLLTSGCVDLKDKVIVDVGSGTGIVAIAAASMGAKVYACDYIDTCVQLMQENVHLNNLEERVTILQLDWNQPYLWPSKVDYLVASDIFYETFSVDPLAKLFQIILSSGGTGIICDPDRSLLVDKFRNEIQEFGDNIFIHDKKQFRFQDMSPACKFIEVSKSSLQDNSPFYKYLTSPNSLFTDYPSFIPNDSPSDIPPPPVFI
jgi:predicted nicotinamide N-methyase